MIPFTSLPYHQGHTTTRRNDTNTHTCTRPRVFAPCGMPCSLVPTSLTCFSRGGFPVPLPLRFVLITTPFTNSTAVVYTHSLEQRKTLKLPVKRNKEIKTSGARGLKTANTHHTLTDTASTHINLTYARACSAGITIEADGVWFSRSSSRGGGLVYEQVFR